MVSCALMEPAGPSGCVVPFPLPPPFPTLQLPFWRSGTRGEVVKRLEGSNPALCLVNTDK